jgi:hypothetical protein
MRLYKNKLDYLDAQFADIAICNVSISYVDNKYIDKIKQNPKLLKNYTTDIHIENCLLILDKDNFIPTKAIHDRKIKNFLISNKHKYNPEQFTYWISKIDKVKEIGETLQTQ